MKKVVIGIFLCVVIVIILFFTWYKKNLQTLNEIKKFNSEFEGFLDREITGVDLTTIINKAIENNNKYEIEKNSNGTYKSNDNNSIEILIKPAEKRKLLSYGGF